MKVLLFNYEYPPIGGGGGVISKLLAEELATRHRVCVITSMFRDLPGHEIQNGVEIVRVPVFGRNDPSAASFRSLLSYPPAAFTAAWRLMRRERFDIVNAHFAVPSGAGSAPAALLGRVPHVVSIHGGDIYDPSKRLSPHRLAVLRAGVTAVLRAADRVVASSTNLRDNAYLYYGYRGPIDLIPLGIRHLETPPATRQELGLPDGVFLGVTIGRIVRRKALDVLLRALTCPECTAVHLAVIGTGPELPALQRLAGELGLAERVRFLRFIDDVRKWQILRSADAYFSSSMHEGFGLVYLEAMACGLPIVTPSHGGQADFLRHGLTGFLVPPGDPNALGAAIGHLVTHPELRARIRQGNLDLAPRYHIRQYAEAYERLYTSLLRR